MQSIRLGAIRRAVVRKALSRTDSEPFSAGTVSESEESGQGRRDESGLELHLEVLRRASLVEERLEEGVKEEDANGKRYSYPF